MVLELGICLLDMSTVLIQFFPVVRAKMKPKTWLILIASVLCIFSLFFFVSFSNEEEGEWDGKLGEDEEYVIKLAREYQIDLDKNLWKNNRESKVKQFLDFMNQASKGVFNFKSESMLEEGYHRYSYTIQTNKIQFPPTIRVRDFTRGNRVGLTTVDLKYRNGDTMNELLQVDGTPADEFLDTAIQKVEQDVHPCDVRWSRGTRLFLDYSPTFATSGDALRYFPGLQNLSGFKSSAPTKKQSLDVYYWQLSHSETLPIGLTYKITFTFMYHSIEAAFSDNSLPSKDGEFSIRLYAENKGHSRKFNEEHLKLVNDLYEDLIWSDWNVDPEMDCLNDPLRDPEELEVWRRPVP